MTKISNLYTLTNYISANSSGNVVIAAPASGYALDVTGTGRFTNTLTINSGAPILRFYANSSPSLNQWEIRQRDLLEGDFGIYDNVSSAYRLYFTPAGTATFSKSLTSLIDIVSSYTNGGGYKMKSTDAVNGRYWWIGNDVSAYGDLAIMQSGGASDATYTSRLYISSVGSIGIGTTSPVRKLDLVGGGMRINYASPSTHILQVDDNVNYGLVVTSGLNTLLGSNTDAGYKLDVSGTVRFKSTSVSTFGFDITNTAGNRGAGFYTTGGNNIQFYLYNSAGVEKIVLDGTNGAATFSSSVTATDLNVNKGGGAWQIIPSSGESALYFKETTSGNVRMTIQSGNVGIGTTSPSAPLSVSNAGGIGMETFVTVLPDSSAGSYLQTYNRSSSAFVTMGFNASEYRWFISNSERMRITSGGNVLIGMTSDVGNKLTVNGNIVAYGSTGGLNILGTYHTGNSTQYAWFNSGNGGMTLTHSGVANVGTFNMSTGVYTTTSDLNKKKDIEESSLGLNEILQLAPKTYRFKTEAENSKKSIGFIAQEVRDVIPYAYTENIIENEIFIGLEYTSFIPVLVQAIKDLKAELDTLKNK